MGNYSTTLTNSITKYSATQFDAIYTRFSPYVMKILRKFCSPNSIDDVTQETFLQVYRSLDSLLLPQQIRHWIASIACRTAMKHRRKAKRKKDLICNQEPVALEEQFLSEGVSADDLLDLRKEVAACTKSLNTLNSQDRFIITRVCLQGFSSAEVAQELGISDSTIRSKVHRFRHSLKNDCV